MFNNSDEEDNDDEQYEENKIKKIQRNASNFIDFLKNINQLDESRHETIGNSVAGSQDASSKS